MCVNRTFSLAVTAKALRANIK